MENNHYLSQSQGRGFMAFDQINQVIVDATHNSLVLVQFQYYRLYQKSSFPISNISHYSLSFMMISPKMAPNIENMEALILKIKLS